MRDKIAKCVQITEEIKVLAKTLEHLGEQRDRMYGHLFEEFRRIGSLVCSAVSAHHDVISEAKDVLEPLRHVDIEKLSQPQGETCK
jgi:hypothetical protein